MKKLAIILFFIPFVCFGQLAKDKQAHLAFSYTFGVAGNGIVWDLTGNKTLALFSGVALGTGIGLAKELYDKNRTGFSTEDLKYDILGAVLGSLTIRIVIGKGIHEKNIPVYDRWKIDDNLVQF